MIAKMMIDVKWKQWKPYNLTTQCCVVHAKPSNFHT